MPKLSAAASEIWRELEPLLAGAARDTVAAAARLNPGPHVQQASVTDFDPLHGRADLIVDGPAGGSPVSAVDVASQSVALGDRVWVVIWPPHAPMVIGHVGAAPMPDTGCGTAGPEPSDPSRTATGDFACAEGTGTDASGFASMAAGNSSTASGDSSHSEGNSSVASGASSHSEGNSAEASGDSSHGEGNSTVASGASSHAEGNSTEASNDSAHAEGNGTVASGASSHAEGNSSQAVGDSAHAEGNTTTATADYSHAEGFLSVTNGDYSHAEGLFSEADGSSSHAESAGLALGDFSHAEAAGKAYADWQFASGFLGPTQQFSVIKAFSGATGSPYSVDWTGNPFPYTNLSTLYFRSVVCGFDTGSNDHAVWILEGCIVVDIAGVYTFLGAPTSTLFANTAGAAGWTATPALAALLGGTVLSVTVTAGTQGAFFATHLFTELSS